MSSLEKRTILWPWLSRACLALALLLLMPDPGIASSRKTFRGEVAVEHGYETNIDRSYTDTESEHESSVVPRMQFTRSTINSNFNLSYAPSLVYNYRTEEDRVDHTASAAYDIQASRRLDLSFSNRYRLAEATYRYTDTEVVEEENDTEVVEEEFEISDRLGKRRFWTNAFSSSLDYEYGRGRFFSIGYDNRMLINRDDIYRDYIRHSPFVTVSHRMTHQWSLRSSYRFTLGYFDGGDDITTHSGDVALFYALSPQTSLFTRLAYTTSEYELSLRDYEVYTATAGFDRKISPVRSISMEAGASQINRDYSSDEEAFFLRGSVNNQLQRGSWRLYGESGIAERSYTGIDEGISRYWTAGARINRVLSENVTGSLGGSYREDEDLDRPERDVEQRSRGDARLTYSFARWYRVSAGYSYNYLNTGRQASSYDNHRVFVRLTAGKDLFRW